MGQQLKEALRKNAGRVIDLTLTLALAVTLALALTLTLTLALTLTPTPILALSLTRRVIDLFREWDTDGDGQITRKEFHTAMPRLGFDVSKVGG